MPRLAADSRRESALSSWAGQHVDVERPSVTPPALLPFSLLPHGLVDRLPQRWWAVGNIYWLRPTWLSVHLCLGISGVRTIEVGGRTVAWGRAAFDFEASQRDAEWFNRRFDRKHGLLDDE